MIYALAAACGLYVWRVHRRLDAVERNDAARTVAVLNAVRALARRQASYVQNTFGTPHEKAARETGAEIFDMLDNLNDGGPDGRQL